MPQRNTAQQKKFVNTTTAVIGPWPLGMTEMHRAADLKPDDLVIAVNMDITDHGQAITRNGYYKICELINGHSIYSWNDNFVVVDNGNLVLGIEKDIILTLRVGHLPLSYTVVNKNLYVSNGLEGYVIFQDLSYHTWNYGWVDVPEISGNGIKDDLTIQPRMLNPIRLVPLPYGYPIHFAFGRLWSAVDTILYFSQPLDYMRMSDEDNYFMFPKPITMLAAVDDGMYIGTHDMVYWLGGSTLEEFTLTEGQSGGCKGGIMLNNFSKELPGNVAFWFHKKHGPSFGQNGGKIQTPLQQRMSPRSDVDNVPFAYVNDNGTAIAGIVVESIPQSNGGLSFSSAFIVN